MQLQSSVQLTYLQHNSYSYSSRIRGREDRKAVRARGTGNILWDMSPWNAQSCTHEVSLIWQPTLGYHFNMLQAILLTGYIIVHYSSLATSVAPSISQWYAMLWQMCPYFSFSFFVLFFFFFLSLGLTSDYHSKIHALFKFRFLYIESNYFSHFHDFQSYVRFLVSTCLSIL